MGVEGLRFVITGAAVGIGAGTARLAAARGAKVVVSDMNDADGQALVEEICAAGGEAIYQHCDVTDEEQVKALMAATAEAFGGIDILHNNAGVHESILSSELSLESMSRATFERVMNINVTGVWLCAKYALPYLRESAAASIINAGSTSSLSGYPQCQAYGASKGAVMQLSKMLAVDLAPDKIRVNCYCPGSIHTQIVDNYLAAAYDHVRSAGGVTIADEVQVGFGRVGSHFWGFESQGVTPDIVTLGKPIGNGHPLGAVVTTPAIADAFANGMEYFNTCGGNPVSCAVGMAVLDVIEEEGLQAHAADVGTAFLAGLTALQREHALIGDVRGLGLFVGVELVLDRETLEPAGEHASYIANRMRDHGIFISTDGPMHNVLKLKPPMPFSRTDAGRVVVLLDNILREDALRVDH